MSHYRESEQKATCSQYGAVWSPAPERSKAGIARNVRSGLLPVNGLRHPPVGDTSGWYIWAGEGSPASPHAAQDARYQGRTVAQWMAQLQGEPSDSEKQAVIDALRHFGPRAVPAVVLMLRDSDPFARLQALWAFFVIGPAPREALPE